ncbi:acyltransferase family protein [Sunxiuqinia sp. A32]|uniref:acyltransferase family protein n=1 Tax=Sunxiuqinia sp. A32 TaxID=3461496 RepID=UPI0040457088
MPTNASLLKTRQHFEILDGLRGIAAIAVVIFHFMEFIFPDYRDNFIAHGYLAVDFFFCLSGFVIAYAYDHRVEKIGIISFLKLRLIRLHPMVVWGAILGLLTFVFDPFSNLFAQYGGGSTFLMFLSATFMAPFPVVYERYFNIFHLNPPTWSLFWEYLANVFYVLLLFKLRNKRLWLLAAVAAVILVFTSFYFKNLAVGWGGDNFWGGGARIFYSFIAGMLIYRSNWIIKSRLGFVALSALLLVVFMIPFSDQVNWFVDTTIVIALFPLLVALGAGAKLAPTLNNSCKFLGDISYPLYIIHYPFLWLFLSYMEACQPSLLLMKIITPNATAFLIVMAYLVMKYMETPMRKSLKRKVQVQTQVQK